MSLRGETQNMNGKKDACFHSGGVCQCGRNVTMEVSADPKGIINAVDQLLVFHEEHQCASSLFKVCIVWFNFPA